jgi:hypothetical protein
MPERRAARPWARVRYPSDFGMSPQEFAARAGWRWRQSGDGLLVTPEENYQRTRPELFTLTRLADASNFQDPSAWTPVSRLQPQDRYQSEDIRRAIESLPEVSNPSGLEDAWVALRLLFTVRPDKEVADFVREQFTEIVKVVPAASAWLIEFSGVLQARLSAARALFAAEVTPATLSAHTDRVALFPGGMNFMRSQMLGFQAYVQPGLMTLSPWLTGISSYRVGGSLVILFGSPVAGFRQVQAPELLNLYRPNSYPTLSPRSAPVNIPPESAEAALRWWVARLNEVFRLALDPTRYCDSSGLFQPSRQVGILMSLERLFACLQGTLAHSGRDEFVRSTLSFEALDILDGLSFGSWEQMVNRGKVEKQLEALKSGMPAEAHAVLVPRCDGALAALTDAMDHFVPEWLDGDLVRVRSKTGSNMELISKERAYAQLLRLTRNASHSYRQHAEDAHELSILACHDGEIPDRVADLALFHVLRFLVSPRLPSSLAREA